MNNMKSDVYRKAYEKTIHEAIKSGLMPSDEELREINARRDAELGESAAKDDIKRLNFLKKKYLAS